MSIHRFEDLVAWQRARVQAREVYLVTGSDRFARDFGLASQIQRAAVSVMANIAEGFEKNRNTEFGRFLDIAKGSLAEVRSHLYIAHDVGYISDTDFERLVEINDNTGKVLSGFRRSLSTSPVPAGAPRRALAPTGHPAPGTGYSE